MRYCIKCGALLPEAALFCPNCGANVNKPYKPTENVEKGTAPAKENAAVKENVTAQADTTVRANAPSTENVTSKGNTAAKQNTTAQSGGNANYTQNGGATEYRQNGGANAFAQSGNTQYNSASVRDRYSPLGVAGFILSFCTLILGLILCIVAHSEAVRVDSKKSQLMAKAGIVVSAIKLGIIVLCVVLFFVILILSLIIGGGPAVT